jgi:hypothetical protein
MGLTTTRAPRTASTLLRADNTAATPHDKKALARIEAAGVDAVVAAALVDGAVLFQAPFAVRGVRASEAAIAVERAIADRRRSAEPLSDDDVARTACAAVCSLLLETGNGACATVVLGRVLAQVLFDDVGGRASGEQRALTEAAAQRASKGYTHGHDCFYQSLGSIIGKRPDEIGSALGYHTSGYDGEDRNGKWSIGADLKRLGLAHRRVGNVFQDVRFGQPRVLPDCVGFFKKDGDALDQLLKAVEQSPIGSRFLVCISGHYLHAVRDHKGAKLVDSQTLSGQTWEVPRSVLRKNAEKFAGAELTEVIAGTTPIFTPSYRAIGEDAFLRDCPFAWESTARVTDP